MRVTVVDYQHSVELGDLFRCAHHDRDATRAEHELRAGGDEPPVAPNAHDGEPQLVVQRQLPDGLVLEGRTRHGKLGELQTIELPNDVGAGEAGVHAVGEMFAERLREREHVRGAGEFKHVD